MYNRYWRDAIKVLVVDDEELIREVVKEYCSNEKYEVLEAEDGLQAIDMVKENDFDCKRRSGNRKDSYSTTSYSRISHEVSFP